MKTIFTALLFFFSFFILTPYNAMAGIGDAPAHVEGPANAPRAGGNEGVYQRNDAHADADPEIEALKPGMRRYRYTVPVRIENANPSLKFYVACGVYFQLISPRIIGGQRLPDQAWQFFSQVPLKNVPVQNGAYNGNLEFHADIDEKDLRGKHGNGRYQVKDMNLTAPLKYQFKCILGAYPNIAQPVGQENAPDPARNYACNLEGPYGPRSAAECVGGTTPLIMKNPYGTHEDIDYM